MSHNDPTFFLEILNFNVPNSPFTLLQKNNFAEKQFCRINFCGAIMVKVRKNYFFVNFAED